MAFNLTFYRGEALQAFRQYAAYIERRTLARLARPAATFQTPATAQ